MVTCKIGKTLRNTKRHIEGRDRAFGLDGGSLKFLAGNKEGVEGEEKEGPAPLSLYAIVQ